MLKLMAPISTIWSLSAGACLMLAAVHVLVWLRNRQATASAVLAIVAAAAGVTAMLELSAMRAATPAAYGEALRWMHVSVALILIGLVWFSRLHLQAGRVWLAWLVTGLRALVLVPNFLLYPNATFREITAVRSAPFFGETLSSPVGEVNPWRPLIHLSMVLVVGYMADVAVTTWRRGRRRQAVVLGGSVMVAFVLTVIFSELMARGATPGPMIGLSFLLITLAMAYEVGADLLRSAELARELQVSQDRVRISARAANLGLWDWDVVGDRLWASEVARARAGLAESEHPSFEQYLQAVHPDDREHVRRAVGRALDSGVDLQVEYRVVGPGGVTRWVAVLGQVERGANGQPLRLRGVSVDVTARRQAEAELERQRGELAHVQRVSAMGQLAAALGHELGQPLGAILRNAEAAELFLRKDPPDLAEVRAIVADIRQDEARAASLIERLRGLMRRGEPRLEPLALDEVVAQVARLLRAELDVRHSTLRQEVPGTLPAVLGDRVQLQQVLLNLVLNALDAMEGEPAERRQVAVRAVQVSDGVVEVAILDQGTGISPDRLAGVFTPFSTTKAAGMGMGLAISKQIIDSAGGRIWAENRPEGGAAFRFTLRVAQAGRAS